METESTHRRVTHTTGLYQISLEALGSYGFPPFALREGERVGNFLVLDDGTVFLLDPCRADDPKKKITIKKPQETHYRIQGQWTREELRETTGILLDIL